MCVCVCVHPRADGADPESLQDRKATNYYRDVTYCWVRYSYIGTGTRGTTSRQSVDHFVMRVRYGERTAAFTRSFRPSPTVPYRVAYLSSRELHDRDERRIGPSAEKKIRPVSISARSPDPRRPTTTTTSGDDRRARLSILDMDRQILPLPDHHRFP